MSGRQSYPFARAVPPQTILTDCESNTGNDDGFVHPRIFMMENDQLNSASKVIRSKNVIDLMPSEQEMREAANKAIARGIHHSRDLYAADRNRQLNCLSSCTTRNQGTRLVRHATPPGYERWNGTIVTAAVPEKPCPPSTSRLPHSRSRVNDRRKKRPPPKRPFTSQLSHRLHTGTAVQIVQAIRNGEGQRPISEGLRHRKYQYKPASLEDPQTLMFSSRFVTRPTKAAKQAQKNEEEQKRLTNTKAKEKVKIQALQPLGAEPADLSLAKFRSLFRSFLSFPNDREETGFKGEKSMGVDTSHIIGSVYSEWVERFKTLSLCSSSSDSVSVDRFFSHCESTVMLSKLSAKQINLPNSLSAAIACDILSKIAATTSRYSGILTLVEHLILSSIYKGYICNIESDPSSPHDNDTMGKRETRPWQKIVDKLSLFAQGQEGGGVVPFFVELEQVQKLNKRLKRSLTHLHELTKNPADILQFCFDRHQHKHEHLHVSLSNNVEACAGGLYTLLNRIEPPFNPEVATAAFQPVVSDRVRPIVKHLLLLLAQREEGEGRQAIDVKGDGGNLLQYNGIRDEQIFKPMLKAMTISQTHYLVSKLQAIVAQMGGENTWEAFFGAMMALPTEHRKGALKKLIAEFPELVISELMYPDGLSSSSDTHANLVMAMPRGPRQRFARQLLKLDKKLMDGIDFPSRLTVLKHEQETNESIRSAMLRTVGSLPKKHRVCALTACASMSDLSLKHETIRQLIMNEVHPPLSVLDQGDVILMNRLKLYPGSTLKGKDGMASTPKGDMFAVLNGLDQATIYCLLDITAHVCVTRQRQGAKRDPYSTQKLQSAIQQLCDCLKRTGRQQFVESILDRFPLDIHEILDCTPVLRMLGGAHVGWWRAHRIFDEIPYASKDGNESDSSSASASSAASVSSARNTRLSSKQSNGSTCVLDIATQTDEKVLKALRTGVALNEFEGCQILESRYIAPPPPPEPVKLQAPIKYGLSAYLYSFCKGRSNKAKVSVRMLHIHKQIADMYEHKIQADIVDDRENNARQAFPEYIRDYFLQKYGLKKPAIQHMKRLAAAVALFCESSSRIRTFAAVSGITFWIKGGIPKTKKQISAIRPGGDKAFHYHVTGDLVCDAIKHFLKVIDPYQTEKVSNAGDASEGSGRKGHKVKQDRRKNRKADDKKKKKGKQRTFAKHVHFIPPSDISERLGEGYFEEEKNVDVTSIMEEVYKQVNQASEILAPQAVAADKCGDNTGAVQSKRGTQKSVIAQQWILVDDAIRYMKEIMPHMDEARGVLEGAKAMARFYAVINSNKLTLRGQAECMDASTGAGGTEMLFEQFLEIFLAMWDREQANIEMEKLRWAALLIQRQWRARAAREKVETMKHDRLQNEERAALVSIFEEHDTDGDGSHSLGEFAAMMALIDAHMDEREVVRMFQQMMDETQEEQDTSNDLDVMLPGKENVVGKEDDDGDEGESSGDEDDDDDDNDKMGSVISKDAFCHVLWNHGYHMNRQTHTWGKRVMHEHETEKTAQ